MDELVRYRGGRSSFAGGGGGTSSSSARAFPFSFSAFLSALFLLSLSFSFSPTLFDVLLRVLLGDATRSHSCASSSSGICCRVAAGGSTTGSSFAYDNSHLAAESEGVGGRYIGLALGVDSSSSFFAARAAAATAAEAAKSCCCAMATSSSASISGALSMEDSRSQSLCSGVPRVLGLDEKTEERLSTSKSSPSSSSVAETDTGRLFVPSVSETGSMWYTVARRFWIVGTRGVEVADAGMDDAEADEGVRLAFTMDSTSEYSVIAGVYWLGVATRLRVTDVGSVRSSITDSGGLVSEMNVLRSSRSISGKVKRVLRLRERERDNEGISSMVEPEREKRTTRARGIIGGMVGIIEYMV